jgi:CubicO group peptidase (beta-lactamase class C family)
MVLRTKGAVMDFTLTTEQQQIREETKKVCRQFPSAHRRDLDSKKAYSDAFVPHLLGLLGTVESLAAACMLAAVFAGCASPAATGPRDAAPGSSAAEPSAAASPRFAQGGSDAEDYGASSGYPVGDRATCSHFRVGCYSHFDQVYEGRLVRRATTPSPLARTAAEPAVRYEYQGQTFTLDDYLARNPATGLLVARGDTIVIERYQYARHDRYRFASWSMAKTVTAMLIGIALAEGHIRSVDDPAAYVPALADTEYGRTSLRHLLQMSSGVRFVGSTRERTTCRGSPTTRFGRPVRRRRSGDSVQCTGCAQRHQVLLRFGRDPSARPRATQCG